MKEGRRGSVGGLEKDDVHSRKGINPTSSLPVLKSPFQGFITIALSGCVSTCSGCVSSMMTFERSRFRYERSLTTFPSLIRVASL